MLTHFLQVFKNAQIISKPLPPLGRWTTNNSRESTIRSILANHDCCGDKLCGNPLHIKEQVDRVFVKQNKNTN